MDKEYKLVISLGILLILFAGINLYFGFSLVQGITGDVISDYRYSHTKAICDENNYCQDYEIKCSNGELVSMEFTGFSIQNSPEWKDPRSEEVISRVC